MHIPVGVYSIEQAKRITGDVPPGVRVVVAPPVVVKPGLRVEILPWETQVEGQPLAGDAGLTERAVARLPNLLAAGVEMPNASRVHLLKMVRNHLDLFFRIPIFGFITRL